MVLQFDSLLNLLIFGKNMQVTFDQWRIQGGARGGHEPPLKYDLPPLIQSWNRVHFSEPDPTRTRTRSVYKCRYSINRGFLLYRVFLLLLRIIFDFTIFPTQIHRIFLLIGCFCLIFAIFRQIFLLLPEKISIFFSFCFFLVFLFTIGQFILFYFSLHLMDRKFQKIGVFCLFLLEPVDAKTPDLYCIN